MTVEINANNVPFPGHELRTDLFKEMTKFAFLKRTLVANDVVEVSAVAILHGVGKPHL